MHLTKKRSCFTQKKGGRKGERENETEERRSGSWQEGKTDDMKKEFQVIPGVALFLQIMLKN